MKAKAYISALRLRTLPLSLSGVSLGAMLAAADYLVDWKVVLFVMLTASFLQILSNLSNELGDFRHGTVSGHGREASAALVSGALTEGGLKVMIRITVLLTVASGLAMLHFTFGSIFLLESFIMMIVGYFAINAAIRYTLGRNPYGYRGLGDLYVFIFFGLVSVWGSYFICSHSFGSWLVLLPAVSIGAFSIGVLNVNNLRDMESDKENRVTVALRMGEKGAKVYQTVLVLVGWIAMTAYACLRVYDPWHFLYVLSLPLFVWHLAGVWKHSGKALDRYLPMLVIATFLFALLAGAGFLVYLM